jgi:hypothetical protein
LIIEETHNVEPRLLGCKLDALVHHTAMPARRLVPGPIRIVVIGRTVVVRGRLFRGSIRIIVVRRIVVVRR